MIPCKVTKILCREKGASTHFPITHLVSPSIFETVHMMLGSVIHLKGVAFDTINNDILNQYKKTWHQALLGLGEEFSVLVTLHRRKEEVDLFSKFKQPFLKEVNDRYHERFKEESIYVNDIYFTVLSKGMSIGKVGGVLNWFSGLSSKSIQKSREWKRQEQVYALNEVVQQLMISLSDFGPLLLGSHDENHSELLQFLALFLNGGDRKQYAFPGVSLPLSMSLRDHKKKQVQYPFGHIGNYLSSHRLFFSDVIEFHSEERSKYAAMISVKRYATETSSRMMDSLLEIDSEYISTNSFFIESKEVAQRLIGLHRRKMENVNDLAVSQIDALCDAQDELASDRVVMGYHHNTIMLLEESLEKLDCAVAQVIKCYADAGFVAIRENIGQEPAFWAQVPGNSKMIARSALVTSENFVDFCSLHNYRSGYCNQNHLGSSVTILRTPSNTPYFFNFHAKGNPDNPSKGHATIIGGNGSGKTVTMAFLDAQLSRYAGRTFVFDRDRGLEIYLRASGGYYAVLSPDRPNTIRFNPFQLSDTSINRKFCREWMAQLIKEEDEVVIPADLSDMLNQCIDYVFDALPVKDRNLSNAAKLLPIYFPRWAHLRRWLRSDGVHTEGEYAYLFDNFEDDFQMQDKVGFDMTHFLDIEPKNVLVSLTMYLFHRLEQSFDGRLVTVLLDEGWQYLDNPYWMQKLRKWLPTLRKLNCHLVLATQSPSSVVDSPIRNMILDNTATNIYFSNPQAKREHYKDGFNLTESEYLCIKEMNPASRYFLLKQEHESCLCRLDLSSMPDILPIFSANRSTILLQESLRKQYGEDPERWLPEFRARSQAQ